LARPERIELPTCWFEASRSIHLSYGRLPSIPNTHVVGVNGGTRTLNPWSHSPVL
jgi:hypothetical protein